MIEDVRLPSTREGCGTQRPFRKMRLPFLWISSVLPQSTQTLLFPLSCAYYGWIRADRDKTPIQSIGTNLWESKMDANNKVNDLEVFKPIECAKETSFHWINNSGKGNNILIVNLGYLQFVSSGQGASRNEHWYGNIGYFEDWKFPPSTNIRWERTFRDQQ